MTAQNAPTNDPLFTQLTDLVKSGQCVAIIGAGVSAGDYPLWTDLVQILAGKCGLRPEDVSRMDPLDIADAAMRKNEAAYYLTLAEVFGRKSAPKSASRYHSLARINFQSYVTLNLDPLLVDILDLHRNVVVSSFPNISCENHRDGDIFHIHGRLLPACDPRHSEIVLTRTDFERAYDPDESRLHAFLQSTFMDHNVCFVGCNPSEPNIRRLLSCCTSIRERHSSLRDPDRKYWYLLWHDRSDLPEVLDRCGIHSVIYPGVDEAFGGLDDVLNYWAGKVPPQSRRPSARSSVFKAGTEPDHG